MLSPFFKDLLAWEWQKQRGVRALPCAATLAVCLGVGIVLGRPAAGMVAAGGAMSVGFGAFQFLGGSRRAPMFWSTVGMSVSALGGSLVGHSGPGALFNGAWAGFGAGLLLALGPGASWIGQQCAIVALVAGGYPVGWTVAADRALLILAGGTLQTVVMIVVWKLRYPATQASEKDPFTGFLPALRTLWEALTPRTEAFHYAVRLSLTVAVAALLERLTGLPNGYWVPMTALIVLKPDFQQTFFRGVERVLGTVLGVGLATLLVLALRLDPTTNAALIVLFAWLGYMLINVNYALYAVFLTAYIVFLLDFGGLSTHVVVLHRALNTVFGGGLALLSYGTLLLSRWHLRLPAPTAASAPAESA